MTQTGLTEEECARINGVFSVDRRIEKVVIFGSRANGRFKPNSDIDFAVYGIEDNLQIERLAAALDELPLAYKFDVVAHGSIEYEPLLEHIRDYGRLFYCRSTGGIALTPTHPGRRGARRSPVAPAAPLPAVPRVGGSRKTPSSATGRGESH